MAFARARTAIPWRAIATSIGVAIAVALASELARRTSGGASPTTRAWSPVGLGIALVYRFGWPALPGVLVGALGVDGGAASAHWRAASAVSEVLGAGFAAWSLRVAGWSPRFERGRDGVVFSVAASACLALSVALSVLLLVLFSALPWAEAGSAWLRWWSADAIGAFVLVPLLLTPSGEAVGASARRGVEFGALLAVTVGAASVAFLSQSGVPLKFLVLPALLWAALRFGPWASSLVVFAVSSLAILGMSLGRSFGAFHAGQGFVLPMFLLTVALVSVLLNAWLAERARSQQAFRKSEERLRLALNHARMGTFEADLATGRVIWDAHHHELYGVLAGFQGSVDEYFSFVHPEDVDALRAAWESAVRRGDAYYADFRIRRADGVVRWMSASGAVLVERGVPSRVVGVVHDITARKDAERERLRLEAQLFSAQKLEAIGTLAGGIAHDFNNILTGILGSAEVARAQLSARHPAAECLADVRAAAVRARSLVVQILTFSRNQRDEATSRAPVDVRRVTDEAVRLLRASFPANVQIQSTLPSQPCVVLADVTQIHQVVMNLGTNAAHAIGDGSGSLAVLLECTGGPSEGEPRRVHLAVSDTGSGIPPEMLDRIFEPFFTTRSPGQGSGLGLSVVHGIVRSHGGVISVESEPGRGSTFHVWLPAAPSDEVRPSSKLVLNERGPKFHVLLVDDEPAVVRAAQRMLKQAGHRVTAFTDPEAALAAFRAAPQDYDVVLTDLTMPSLTGTELTGRLLELRPDLPVVLSTGFGPHLDEAQLSSFGFRALLRKPYSTDELARVLARASVH